MRCIVVFNSSVDLIIERHLHNATPGTVAFDLPVAKQEKGQERMALK